MEAIKLPAGVWVVVCDGRKALILENAGDADYPDLRTRATDEQAGPPSGNVGADRPGRVHQSANSRRSAMEETDWHDEAEKAFVTDLVRRLDAALQAKDVDKLVIVAPPRALGVMRKAYTGRLKAALHAEIAKDLTAVPVHKIESQLTGA
jgi:protein required for attachment to host cells